MTAPDWDVVHSWWIPALGGKIDAIPGRSTTTWFEAEAAGVFRGQCAELCGIYHAKMLAPVEVLPAARSSTRGSPSARRSRRHGTSPLGEESGRASARSATGSTARAATGRRSRARELVRGPRGDRSAPARGPRRTMPPVGRDWDERADGRADRLPRGAPWRLTLSRSPSPPGSAARSRAGSSPSTTSGSGSSTSAPPGLFFALAGFLALLIRTQLAQADERRDHRRLVQRGGHDARHGDGLLRRRPDPRRARRTSSCR